MAKVNLPVSVAAKGSWFVSSPRDRAGLRRSFGGPAEHLGRTPGEIRPPSRGQLQWYANDSLTSADLDAVRAGPLADRIVAIDVGRTTITDHLLQALSSFSPRLKYVTFTECRAASLSRTLSSTKLVLVAFGDTDPRVVGPLPYFLQSVLLAGLDPLPRESVEHAANGLPENLFLRAPVSESGIAYALARNEIRRVDVWGAVDLNATIAELERSAPRPTRGRGRLFSIRGAATGDQAEARALLRALGIRLEVTRPRRRSGRAS